MYESTENLVHRVNEPVRALEDEATEPFLFNEAEPLLFIDLRDSRGWAELESALPEGAIDNLSGEVV